MTHPIEEALMQSVKDNNAVFMAGYEEGYEAGKREALAALNALAGIAVKIDARLAEWARGGAAPAPRETIDAPAPATRMRETQPTAALAQKASEHNAPIDAAAEAARLEKAAAWLIGKIASAPDKAAIDRLCKSNAADIERIGIVLPERKIEIMSAIAEKANEFYTPSYEADQGDWGDADDWGPSEGDAVHAIR